MPAKTPRFAAQSRYAEVAGYTRRSVLGIGLGALATLVGCRSSDEDVFANGNSPTEAAVGDTSTPPTSIASGETQQGGDATLQVQVDGDASTDPAGSASGTAAVETTGGTVDGSTPGSGETTTPATPGSGETTTTAMGGESTTSPTTSAQSSTTASTAAPTTAQATTTAAPTTTTSTTTRPAGPATALPAGADLVVDFTYTKADGGKNVPPYIAVWIEDDSGDLVETVVLWYQQFGRGENWLPDLRRWYNTTGGSATDSGPTRAPGRHQVAWGGSSEFGEPMPPGRYYVCVESARERGPYSLVRTAVDLNGSAVNIQLGTDGELTAASARTA